MLNACSVPAGNMLAVSLQAVDTCGRQVAPAPCVFDLKYPTAKCVLGIFAFFCVSTHLMVTLTDLIACSNYMKVM